MNPFLQELGYDAKDRVLLVHADDIGMCQASTSVLSDLFEAGIVRSAATMVPCPWFLEAAELCRQNPEFDIGVHLTLNAEWSRYRWGALSTRDQASGLLDAQGFLHSSTAATHEQADPQAVAREIEAQFEAALLNLIVNAQQALREQLQKLLEQLRCGLASSRPISTRIWARSTTSASSIPMSLWPSATSCP